MYEKRIPAELSAWNIVRNELAEVLSAAGVDETQVRAFLVAAEEIFANIAAYAYPEGRGDCGIRLEEADGPGGAREIRLTLADHGIPFDPTQHRSREPIRKAKGESPGGFGIAMARERTDGLQYERSNGENRLTLIINMKERKAT